MKTLTTVVALAVAVWADLRTAEGKADPKGVGSGLAERIQDMYLTDEQEAKLADIRKEYRPKVQKAAKELAAIVNEEVEKVRGVLAADQKGKLKALKELRGALREETLVGRLACLKDLDLTDGEITRIAEIRKEYQPKIEGAMKKLGGLLTDDQKKAREQALKAGKKRSEVIQSLQLTDEQLDKVVAVGKEVRGRVREELEKIRAVLSDEQKAKLVEIKAERKQRVRDRLAFRIAAFKVLNLTDEQATRIADIRKEYRPKVQEAGNKLRAIVREEAGMIVVVLED
jgi:Spy/CpxP family protein refolding chaperone